MSKTQSPIQIPGYTDGTSAVAKSPLSVIGGTGSIGTKLVNKLRQSGHEVEGIPSDARRGQTDS